MFIRTFASLMTSASRLALRGPEDDMGGGEDPFAERPEDREPEGEPIKSVNDDEEAPPEAQDGDGGETGTDDPPGEETAPAGSGEEPPPEGDADDAEDKPKRRDWRDRQLEKRAAQLKEKDEQLAAAQAEAQALRDLYARDEDGNPVAAPMTEAEALRRAEAKVRAENDAKRLNEAADKVFDDGAAKYPATWQDRINAAGELFADEIRARPEFLEVVTELDNGADVYHELAGDPDQMEALLRMPAHKMAMEISKLSVKLAKPKPVRVSQAPAPIKPLEKPGIEERPLEDLINDPKADLAEIDRRMKAQERSKYEARR